MPHGQSKLDMGGAARRACVVAWFAREPRDRQLVALGSLPSFISGGWSLRARTKAPTWLRIIRSASHPTNRGIPYGRVGVPLDGLSRARDGIADSFETTPTAVRAAQYKHLILFDFQFCRMPEALITFSHFTSSLRIKSSNSRGVLVSTSAPSVAKRSRTSGAFSCCTTT